MKGKQGEDQQWCAGFVCFILKQACVSMDVRMPIKASVSCDILANDAIKKGIFLADVDIQDKSTILPGTVFLDLKRPGDWNHTGFVIDAEDDLMHTIEGNTNHNGSDNGYTAL